MHTVSAYCLLVDITHPFPHPPHAHAVATFSREEEAVSLANDSEYGLAGAVISADAARCRRVAEALECGIVWVNCSQPCFCQVGGGAREGVLVCGEGGGYGRGCG